MTAAEFSQLAQNPGSAGSRKQADWDLLVSRFPYAAAIHVLRVLNENPESADFPEILHLAAARTLSRSRLQFMMEGVPELEAEWLESSTIVPVDAPAEEAETISVPQPEAEIPSLPTSGSGLPEFGFSFVKVRNTGKKATPKPQKKEIPAGKSKAKKTRQQDLIDRFIHEEPILQPRLEFGEQGKLPDLARKSGKLQEEIVSESMAMIYIKQKKYPQAIATLHKLSLKFPDKSLYFAALIKNLENQKPT